MDLRCENCGAHLVVAPELKTVRCPYCGLPSIIERPPGADRPEPTFVLGFSLTQKAARERVGEWLKRRSLFTRSGIRNASLEDVRGIYLPAYLYSAVADADYEARIGENYTETETYTTTDSQGNTQVHTRTVVKTEWRELSGRHTSRVADVLVTASRGLPNPELAAVEPFDLRALHPYTPGVLAGWIAEEPSLDTEASSGLARAEARKATASRVEAFMPGDSHRLTQCSVDLRHESLEATLIPLWVLAARYRKDAPPVRVVVNGQTGKIHGKAPLSWVKISVTALVAVALLVGLYFLLPHLGGGA